MPELIPAPVLDSRDEEQIAAEVIARVSGGLTPEAIEKGIAVWLRLREMVEAGNLPVPACPELTNANPSSPHTALLEAMALLAAFQSYKLNLLPEKNKVEFHRLFGIELRDPTPAIVTLLFTSSAPVGVSTVIPAGTQVATEDLGEEAAVFETDEELVIAAGDLTGTVAATRTAAGFTQLAAGALTRLVDPVAFVSAVTNPAAVESGSDAETVESALARARSYQRRGERLVSARDLEDVILHDVLLGNGVVKAFPLVEDGNWEDVRAGHTTVVVMTKSGGAVDAAAKEAAGSLLGQAVGAPYVWVKDPAFVDFTVEADVRVAAYTTQAAVVSAVKTNLLAFYAPTAGNFGRSILRSEIIAVVEGTPGLSRIEPQPGGEILAAPLADVALAPYELPKLEAAGITINVVL